MENLRNRVDVWCKTCEQRKRLFEIDIKAKL